MKAQTPSFFLDPGHENKQDSNLYSISDPQHPAAAKHRLFHLSTRTAATSFQGMTRGPSTGESPANLPDSSQESCLAGSMRRLTKLWLGLEKLTRLMHLKSWDNHRSNGVAQLIQTWNLGERKKMTNPEVWWGLSAHKSRVVLTVSNKAETQ